MERRNSHDWGLHPLGSEESLSVGINVVHIGSLQIFMQSFGAAEETTQPSSLICALTFWQRKENKNPSQISVPDYFLQESRSLAV